MKTPLQALYCDGLTPDEKLVTVIYDQEMWYLKQLDAAPVLWSKAELKFDSYREAEGLLYSHRVSDATLLVYFEGQDLRHLPGYSAAFKRKTSGKVRYALALLGFTALTIALLISSLRPLSYALAANISPARERALFGPLLEKTDFLADSCEDPEAQLILKELGQAISQEERAEGEVDFVLVDWNLANAFALPGRKIVVTRGLLRKMESSEQLVGVLSHELGHVQLRHSLAEIMRASFAAVAWGVLVGDFTGAFVLDPSLMKQLGEQAYSREAETEADQYGAENMQRQGFDPKALGQALLTLTGQEAGSELETGFMHRVIALFSSHPETQQRVAELNRDYQANKGREPLSAERWQLLQNACK